MNMYKVICFVAIVCPSIAVERLSAQQISDSSGVVATQPDFSDFDHFVEQVLKEWRVPGVAIAVIDENQTILTKGYGYRDLEKRLPVTAQTLFPIASITKSFTATAAAILVDENKIHWNDRVREHLPDFRLQDEMATAELTLRDCLSHQTGLPLECFRWYGTRDWSQKNASPEMVYRTLRFLEPSAPVGTRFLYSNSGYLITGQMIDRYGGSWEEFIQGRILDPLGMSRTNFSVTKSQEDADYAVPYELFENEIIRHPLFPLHIAAPAAGINSTVEDMAQFLKLYLTQGEFNDKQIVSRERMKDLLTPEVVLPEFNHYESTIGFHGMGWQVLMIQGEKWGRHTGSWIGFTAVAGFCPKRKCAYVVLTNLAYLSQAELIEANIRTRLRGQKPAEQFDPMRRMDEESRASEEKAKLERRPTRIEDTRPTYPLNKYVGKFTNPAYGEFEVSLQGGKLRWQHHGFQGALQHYHYDVFDMEGNPDDRGKHRDIFCRELVKFQDSATGTIESLSFSRSMPSDIQFSRVASSDSKASVP